MRRWRGALLLGLAAAGAAEEQHKVGAVLQQATALASDDECVAGDEGCALNALQHRLVRVAAREVPAADRGDLGLRRQDYGLVWAARGASFFEQFHFLDDDDSQGSAEYLSKAEAIEAGVAQAHGTHAILRAGPASRRQQYKRQSAKIATQGTWRHLLVAMKYSHLPYGCGVWPALFTLAPGAEWPAGGEVDILEYVNMDLSKSSFHTASHCKLKAEEVNRFGDQPDRNHMDYDCRTEYPHSLGCAPSKWMRNGQQWAQNPGIIAMEWTEAFIKIFHIPEDEVFGDLELNNPRPDTWDQWLFSYYPLAASRCGVGALEPQQLVMQISFCGDWASKAWGLDPHCNAMAQQCRSVDSLHEHAPHEDCCTKFINDPAADSHLGSTAFFNISWVKIYQQGI